MEAIDAADRPPLITLKNDYLVVWQNIKSRSDEEDGRWRCREKLDSPIPTLNADTVANEDTFILSFMEADRRMLRIMQLYYTECNGRDNAFASVLDYHHMIVAQNGEINLPRRFTQSGACPRLIRDRSDILSNFRERYRKNCMMLQTLIQNTNILDRRFTRILEENNNEGFDAMHMLMYRRLDCITDCYKSAEEKIWALIVMGGLQQLRAGFLRDHFELCEDFLEFAARLNDKYELSVREETWDYYAEEKSVPLQEKHHPRNMHAATQRCAKKLLEAIKLMFRAYRLARLQNRRRSYIHDFPYLSYIQSIKHLDVAIDQLEDIGVERFVIDSIMSIRTAIPLISIPDWWESLRSRLFGIPNEVQKFCNKVELYWS